MKIQYLIRLDDACPTMNNEKWLRVERLLDKYGIKPLVGIIPKNEDPQQRIDPEDGGFWNKVKSWNDKGWSIAMHGYNHVYQVADGGINPLWNRSEFVGLSLEEQKKKIRKGVAIMREYGLNPKFFFAPSHTFDENTLTALLEESDIRIVSDTIATRPYRYREFVIIPQFSGKCREMMVTGVYTFCLHPNTMREDDFKQTECFVKKHIRQFTSFTNIQLLNLSKKSLFDRFLSWIFFKMRKKNG